MTGCKAARARLLLAGLLLAAAGQGHAQEAEAPQAPPAEAAPAPTVSAPSDPLPERSPPERPIPERPVPEKLPQREPATGAQPSAPAAAPKASAPQARRPAAPTERTAVIAVLDKRLGTTADFTLNPGQRFAFGRLSGVLQTCERTQPHERPQSGAFVQVIEQPPGRANQAPPKPRLVFSGWLFAESPSLNPFIHPVYDVWLKSCTMRFPDGPPAPSGTSRGTTRATPGAPPKASGAGATGGG